MNYSDLSSEEQEIINSLRGMNQSRRNAVMASQN